MSQWKAVRAAGPTLFVLRKSGSSKTERIFMSPRQRKREQGSYIICLLPSITRSLGRARGGMVLHVGARGRGKGSCLVINEDFFLECSCLGEGGKVDGHKGFYP